LWKFNHQKARSAKHPPLLCLLGSPPALYLTNDFFCAVFSVGLVFFVQCRNYLHNVRLVQAPFRQIYDSGKRFLRQLLSFTAMYQCFLHTSLTQTLSFAAEYQECLWILGHSTRRVNPVSRLIFAHSTPILRAQPIH
jgi:hypothetical protein